ncbi:MAG: hypothetical protein JSU07_04125 [Bacteroidetes bacterium]|nr:hypothetical protein [Bacteroidota bacterium]
MKNLIAKYKPEIIGAALGGAIGLAYWYFIGCSSGTCAITSKPLNSTIYGMLMGSLLFNIFKSNKNIKTNNNEQN